MAGRIRSIKPEILEDEEVASLSSHAWRLWVSMWTIADDFGNLRAAPAMLNGQVFWARPLPADVTVDQLLAELVAANRIVLYQHAGAQYAHVRNWEKHQRITNAGDPRVPACPGFAATRGELRRLAALPRSGSPTTTTTTTTTTDQQPAANDAPPVGWLDEVYEKYPRKVSRVRGEAALAQLSDDDRHAFTKAVTAYARQVVAEQTPPRYVTTWPVFCEGKWREYVPVEKQAGKAPSVYELTADPPPPKREAK